MSKKILFGHFPKSDQIWTRCAKSPPSDPQKWHAIVNMRQQSSVRPQKRTQVHVRTPECGRRKKEIWTDCPARGTSCAPGIRRVQRQMPRARRQTQRKTQNLPQAYVLAARLGRQTKDGNLDGWPYARNLLCSRYPAPPTLDAQGTTTHATENAKSIPEARTPSRFGQTKDRNLDGLPCAVLLLCSRYPTPQKSYARGTPANTTENKKTTPEARTSSNGPTKDRNLHGLPCEGYLLCSSYPTPPTSHTQGTPTDAKENATPTPGVRTTSNIGQTKERNLDGLPCEGYRLCSWYPTSATSDAKGTPTDATENAKHTPGVRTRCTIG